MVTICNRQWPFTQSFLQARHKGVPSSTQQYYVKWLRYYLDFCHKYNFQQSATGSLAAFGAKLKEKKQNEKQREQAKHAVSLYFKLASDSKNEVSNNFSRDNKTAESQNSFNTPYSHTQQSAFYQVNQPDAVLSLQIDKSGPSTLAELKQSGADWTGIFNELKNAVKARGHPLKDPCQEIVFSLVMEKPFSPSWEG